MICDACGRDVKAATQTGRVMLCDECGESSRAANRANGSSHEDDAPGRYERARDAAKRGAVADAAARLRGSWAEAPAHCSHDYQGAPALRRVSTIYGLFLMCEACAIAGHVAGYVLADVAQCASEPAGARCQCEHVAHGAPR
jgi:hypothetical protein